MKQRPLPISRHLVLSSSSRVFLLLLPAAERAAADNKTLTGHVPAAVRELNLQPTGRLAAEQQLHLSIALPLHNKQALVDLIQQIYSPTGTNYHRYLTTEQFTEQFGPTVQEYQSVQDFARSNRLAVEATFGNRALVDVSGNVSDIEAALHITLRTYWHPTENREFYAPDVEPTVDASLPISKINGLDNYFLPRPGNNGIRPPGSTPGGGPDRAVFGDTILEMPMFRTRLLSPARARIVGLFELDGFYPSDITAYENYTGLARPVPNRN